MTDDRAERAGQNASETDWERRRRLAAVFGDTLPETTRDERDDDVGEKSADQRSEEWLQQQVPPHHGT